jgi:outer membrane protein OmpA-like peptidoglycan-associated protein
MVAATIIVLGASGCASKKYVRNQINPVNQKVAHVEKTTNDKIAYLNNQQKNDISQVNERISTTDQKVADVANMAQQAQGTASRAMEESDANKTAINDNSTAITNLTAGVANSLNYQLVEKGDVTFGFNKATLTPEAKAMLDQIAAKVQGLPRAVVELTGFTDKTGSASYNLALSRRRAEAVQRYLISQNVPLRCIHIVGMGKEAPPSNLTSDLEAVNPNPTKAEMSRLARRVHVGVYGAGDITQGSAGRSQQ